MKPLAILVTLLLAGCLTQPEKQPRVIHCGDLDFSEEEPNPKSFRITDSTCVRVED